jgi:FkbM family methyltransferase
LFSFNLITLAVKTFFSHPISFINILRSRPQQLKESANPIGRLLTRETQGFEILIDPKDPGVAASIILFGMAEPPVTEVFKRITKPGMTVLDIGANIGWYSLLGARLVGKNGQVISVEPEHRNFEMLSQSVAMNKFQNISLINACITNTPGEVKLYLSASNPGGHSIVFEAKDYIECQGLTVDQILEDQGRIDIMKIDAESAEPLILRGATELLNTDLPLHIVMEYSPLAWKGYEVLLSDLFQKFQVFRIYPSPFLERQVKRDRLPTTKQCMLHLQRN